MATSDNATRRAVLKAGVGLAAAPAIAAAGWPEESEVPRTLVLLHLAGGNDGLNTIIPMGDPLYRELRPTLSAAAEGALPIGGGMALHRALAPLLPLYEAGQLAIVQGAGYAEPDYSHIGSRHMWLTGTRDRSCTRLWWQDVMDGRPELRAVCMGRSPDGVAAFAASSVVHVIAPGPEASKDGLGEHRPGYLGESLRKVVQAVASRRPPVLVFVSMSGFDTHAGQLPAHARLLAELAGTLAGFMADLQREGIAERVIVATWSEFGRRIAENATGGTDHGAAGPMLVLGAKVRGGIYGQRPSLSETEYGSVSPTTDLRDVYAALAPWIAARTFVTRSDLVLV